MSAFLEAQYHRNVMEQLVQEEIARQTVHYSSEELEYLNLVEVSAYALNRLPPLYATSHEGAFRQHKLGCEKMVTQLRAVVGKALERVPKDSPRLTTPLMSNKKMETEKRMAQLALTDLADYLSQLKVTDD